MWKQLTKLLPPVFAKAQPIGELRDRFPQHKIGKGTYAEDIRIMSWGEGATLTIGNYCSIAGGVTIFLGGEHRTDWVTTFPFSVLWEEARHIAGHPRTKGNVTIGSDVWLGWECVVGSGVSIGHGAVVGARAVVTKDVPPYAIVAGNPATVVKYRFNQETIDALLRIEWWNWDEDRIRKNMDALLSNRLAEFLDRHS